MKRRVSVELGFIVTLNLVARGIDTAFDFDDFLNSNVQTRKKAPVVSSIKAYFDKTCTAIENALDLWMKLSSVMLLSYVGDLGIVLPRSIEGPDLSYLIYDNAPKNTETAHACSRAISDIIGKKWASWHHGLSGLLYYPYPGSSGPNMPTPLITFNSAGESGLAPAHLCAAMLRLLPDLSRDRARPLLESLSEAFFTYFQVLKTNTVIAGVLCAPRTPRNGEEYHFAGKESSGMQRAGGLLIPTTGNFL